MAFRRKRIFSLALAVILTASFPTVKDTVFAAEVQYAADSKPILPDDFGQPLEDSNGVACTDLANKVQLSGFGAAIEVGTQWNNENKGHAVIENAADLFQKTAFTVLMDVKQQFDVPDRDADKTDQRVALTIGNETNSIHLLTYSGKLGFGGNTGGISTNMTELSGVNKDGWNAVAMTYEETGAGNGHIIVYINGAKAAEVADIGFKLSTLDHMSAMLARTYGTNYLQQGCYDNLVVGNTVLDESAAIAETAYRRQEKEGIPDYTVAVKGSDVELAAANTNGLTYKGFGMLNGNSTSNLLLDYKSKSPDKYEEMMQYLFGGEYPLFTHIKMEMGNDGNNSTGAEACTMRYEEEEADASRSPGFVMAADAKKINPHVKISILRWEMPKWVSDKWNKNTDNQGYEAMYKWYKETVFDAYEKYHYMVDFINPDKNETGNPDTAFIKWFSNRIKNETQFPSYIDAEAQAKYKNIRIIASDENKGLKIVPAMREDAELYNAVDIIGFHYRTNATDDYVKMADEDDKEVWYSEGCATFGYSELHENKTVEYGAHTIGGYQSPLALMDSFITAFDSSRRTHYMFQPAIGSFYEGIQYGHKELLSARDPWSGYIHYDPALYMLEHFAKFARTGWEDSSPDTNDIWRVIRPATKGAFAGSDNEHATAGIQGNAGYMTLASPDKKDFSVVMVNNTQNAKTFFISAEDMALSADASLNLWVTETDSYLQDKGTADKKADGWKVTMPAYSVGTATTLNTQPERAPVDGIHKEDRAVLDTDATGGTNGSAGDKVLYADNFEYAEETARYLEERGYEPRYMLDAHGAWVVENGRLKQELGSSVGQWNPGDPSTIVGDFRWMDYAVSADVEIPNAADNVWTRLTARSQSGMNWDNSGYTLSINGTGNWELHRIGTKVSSGTVLKNADGKYKLSLMCLGDTVSVLVNGEIVTNYKDPVPMLSGRVKLSSTWNQVYFDNLLVETVDGGIPYAAAMIDGQDDSVVYEGNWTIDNPGGGSADNWYRTMSVTSSPDASFSFPIDGSGFSIVGTNDGSAKLDVYVDNELVGKGVSTAASTVRGETYLLSDLKQGNHTIRVVVKSGKLQIDALHTLGERLSADENTLISVKTELPSVPVMLTGSSLDDLPAQVDVLTANGSVVKKNVVWNTLASQFEGKEFQKAFLTGTVLGGVNAVGYPLTVSVPVEMIIPSGTVYFIDSVEGNASKTSTEPYEKVKSVLGNQLLNQTADQKKTSDNAWGLAEDDAQTKGYNNNTADMTATGIYGKENAVGETLSYAFTLPAGTYKLISGHREWWNMNRPMAANISFDGQEQDVGTISLSGSSGDIFHMAEFTLDRQQLVTYTLTAKEKQAPVISWLGIVKKEQKAEHTHEYTIAEDNGNGTHTLICKDGDSSQTEPHTWQANVCIKCGAKNSQGPEGPQTPENPGAQNPSVSLQKPVVSKLENAGKGVKINWKKVSDASGYYVERKTGNGKWQSVKTISKVSATSWTDTKASKNGQKYQYRVYAYRGSVKSAASSAKTIYRLTAKNITGLKNVNGKKIQLKWSKNTKAGGYEIQYALNSKFSKAKKMNVSGGAKSSKIISSGLQKGRKYYIRIRNYKKSGKTKYYSCWSKVKSIKVSK